MNKEEIENKIKTALQESTERGQLNTEWALSRIIELIENIKPERLPVPVDAEYMNKVIGQAEKRARREVAKKIREIMDIEQDYDAMGYAAYEYCEKLITANTDVSPVVPSEEGK